MNVTIETTVPLNRLKGTNARTRSVSGDLISGVTAALMLIIASVEKFITEPYNGSVRKALTGTATRASASVPMIIEVIAPLRVLCFT